MWCQELSILIRLIVGENFQQKENGFVFLAGILKLIYTLKFLT